MREAGGAGDRAVETDAVAVTGNTVQRLRPPLIGGDAESRDGGGGVNQLQYLLIQCQPGNQVPSSLVKGQRDLAEFEGFGVGVGGVA